MKKLLVAILLTLCASPFVQAARVFTSGFETNDFSSTEWGTVVNTPTIQTTTVHSGTYATEFSQTAATETVLRTLGTATSGTTYVRIYLYVVSLPSADDAIIRVTGSADSFRIVLTTAGKLKVRNSVTATDFDSTSTLSTSTWYRIETRHLLSDTVGQIEARLFLGDSTSALEAWGDGNFTGGDGSDGDTLGGNVTTLILGSSTGVTADFIMDDVAVNDATGTTNTSWAGPGKIALVKPASNNSVTWTKTGANCSGTTNTDCVDDVPGAPDDASGYNTSSTANNEDRFNMTGLPAEVPTTAVMKVYDIYDRWDGNGTTGTRQGRNLGWDNTGAQTNGPTHSRCDVTAGTWSNALTQHLPLDLTGKTKSQVDSYTVGYEPLNAAECRVSAIWANVEWIEAQSCVPTLGLLGVSGCG